jgi:hypothetical protein
VSGHSLNQSQRVVIVIGLAVALCALGDWLTGLGSNLNYGWVAYAPLGNQDNFTGLHPWVRLLIWIVLIAFWVAASLMLFKSRSPRRGE